MTSFPPSCLRLCCLVLLAASVTVPVASARAGGNPWTRSSEFSETSFTTTTDGNVRVYVNAPLDGRGNPARGTWLLVYTLPAGNTIEQTLGCQMKPGLDWHYDIQHVAAQVRLLRTLAPDERIVLVCPEGPGHAWSQFRKAHPDANERMGKMLDGWRKELCEPTAHVMLTGHSNGGSFIFGVIDSAKEIPAYIDRIAFLDANYNFNAMQHAGKLERWLKGDNGRRLVVIAYDDREIMLNGKKVLGPTGGTYRATGRMRDALSKVFPLTDTTNPPFQETTGLDGQIHFFVHPNPLNKIMHTLLVGDMNGLVHAATLGTQREETWGHFGGPRAFTKWIQKETAIAANPSASGTKLPAATATSKPVSATRLGKEAQVNLPPRPKDALGGAAFMKRLQVVPKEQRESTILHEILSGNFPDFLLEFRKVPLSGKFKNNGKAVDAEIVVMPDYLAIGSDNDFVRIPMTPQTAQQIADRFGCTLPTRKMVDAIDRAAEVRLAPHPMTVEREAIATFAEHNAIVEKQRAGKPLGALTIGSKKDIVLTPRIFERPHRLAIYGWRQLNGQPIQPLTIVHVDHYVDYSHGVRLVKDDVAFEGKHRKISEMLEDATLANLVSDEGPMTPPRYPTD